MRSALRHGTSVDLALAGLLAAALLAACGGGRAPVLDVAPLTDTTDTVGPYAVTVLIRDDGAIATAQVRYFPGPGAAPQPVALVRDGTTDRWTAGIPGQPSGTTVRYVIEVEDDEGNLVVAPPAPAVDDAAAAYAFTVLEGSAP